MPWRGGGGQSQCQPDSPGPPPEACTFDPEAQKLALVVVPKLENSPGGPRWERGWEDSGSKNP